MSDEDFRRILARGQRTLRALRLANRIAELPTCEYIRPADKLAAMNDVLRVAKEIDQGKRARVTPRTVSLLDVVLADVRAKALLRRIARVAQP